MIMIGPNGYGKTMTLRIIDALFNHPTTRLVRLPFRRAKVSFDNGSSLVVDRGRNVNSKEGDLPVRISLYEGDKKRETYCPTKPSIDPRSLDFPLSLLEENIPSISRVDFDIWRNIYTGEKLESCRCLSNLRRRNTGCWSKCKRRQLPRQIGSLKLSQPIPVRLIGTERLTKESLSHADWMNYRPHGASLSWHQKSLARRTVRVYSEELSALVNQAMTEYGTLSQSLDRTFPARVVADSDTGNASLADLQGNLDRIETRRQELEEVGLTSERTRIAFRRSITGERGCLKDTPFYRSMQNDAREKLSLFDDLYEKSQFISPNR